MCSFLIPLWQSEWIQSWFVTEQVREVVTTISLNEIVIAKPRQTVFDWQAILLSLYWLGTIISAGIFALKLIKTILLLQNTNGNNALPPFSFMGYRFVPETIAGREIISNHEHVHSRQWHSLDIIFIEIVVCFSWFNPVVYALKQSLKNIHEFIADSHAVAVSSKADYAMLLFSQAFQVTPHTLSHHFFDKMSLKRRITMLNKNQSPKTAILKYGFIAPLFLSMLIFTASCMNHSAVLSEAETSSTESISVTGTIVSASDKKALPGVIVKLKNSTRGTTTDIKGVFRLDNVPRGSELEVSFAGFETITYSVPVRSNKHVSFIATLKEGNSKQATSNKKLLLLEKTDDNEVFTAVEEPPAYPGGMDEMRKFLASNIQYPLEASKNNIQGKVFVSFVVGKDGSIENTEVLKGIGGGCDEEAMRVISIMPKWFPGKQNGNPVRVKFTLPVTFATDNVVSVDKAELANAPNYFLLLVDGKEAKVEDLKNLKPADIEKINIIKDAKALESYGEKGKNGVVEITIKK